MLLFEVVAPPLFNRVTIFYSLWNQKNEFDKKKLQAHRQTVVVLENETILK